MKGSGDIPEDRRIPQSQGTQIQRDSTIAQRTRDRRGSLPIPLELLHGERTVRRTLRDQNNLTANDNIGYLPKRMITPKTERIVQHAAVTDQLISI